MYPELARKKHELGFGTSLRLLGLTILLGASNLLAACGFEIRDNTPTVRIVVDPSIGSLLCGDELTFMGIEQNNAVFKTTSGELVHVEDGGYVNCGEDRRLDVTGLYSNGTEYLSARVVDYNK